MKKVFRNVFTAAFLLLILIGCSTTKRIADDEVLYTGVKKMEIIPDSGVKIADAAASDVRSTLSVAPNNPLFSPYIRTPFPIGLWVWNYMEPKREKGVAVDRKLVMLSGVGCRVLVNGEIFHYRASISFLWGFSGAP